MTRHNRARSGALRASRCPPAPAAPWRHTSSRRRAGRRRPPRPLAPALAHLRRRTGRAPRPSSTSLELAVLARPRPVEPPAHQRVDMVARLVVRPFLVHRIVDARQDAHHLALADVDADVGADRVHDVDPGHLRQLPRPRLEAVGLRQQRADRAQVDEIARQFAAERLLEVGRDLAVLAADTACPCRARPATSSAKRMQRVHWMQRVIAVLTIGPIYLSSTLRLCSS